MVDLAGRVVVEWDAKWNRDWDQADLLAKAALVVACDRDLQIQPKVLHHPRPQQQARQERCKNRGRTPARRMADAAAR